MGLICTHLCVLLSDLMPLLDRTGRGVFVKLVENDPAKSDGRIQPGDEIIQVRCVVHHEIMAVSN